MQSASNNLLLHFEVNPLSQAVEMNGSTGARTLAGVEEKVLITLYFF